MAQRILIIDDEADLREAMCTALSGAGFECLEAKNGKEGVTMALEEKPDLILLDILMPVMDGHEALAHLRRDSWGKDVPVIQLTSMDDAQNITESVERKSDDYIIKSTMDLSEIVKKVKQHVAGYHG